ncbi:hypothetical protein D0D76_24235 [Vibrio parahaemolyticus]|nr:hypothetical protein [Vibrio parahaemolyticus]OQU17999.1 hypothetical protein EM47_022815 [Vibrio parahaemolyticus]
MLITHITKHSRGIHNAWQFWFELALVFTAQWFRSGGLRCSPLNAALYGRSLCTIKRINMKKSKFQIAAYSIRLISFTMVLSF